MRNRSGAITRIVIAALLVSAAFGALAWIGGVGPAASAVAGPASEEQYGPPRVTICHHARVEGRVKHVTIRVRRSFLRGHLRHGDTIGRCGTARSRRLHSTKAHVEAYHPR